MGRLGTAEDIGNVAALLCSDQASWITGQTIYAVGGASLMAPEAPPEIQFGYDEVRTGHNGSRHCEFRRPERHYCRD
jgi:hypothetical protein